VADFTMPDSTARCVQPGKKGFVVTAAAGFTGAATFNHQISDREETLDSVTVRITVSDNPSPVGDLAPLVTNDSLVVGRFTQPTDNIGSIGFGTKGGLEFTPNPNVALGTTGTFNDVIYDAVGLQTVGGATVRILQEGNPGALVIANPELAASAGGKPVAIKSLASDSNVFGNNLMLVDVAVPNNGFVTLEGDVVTCTPFAGFQGVESFAYQIQKLGRQHRDRADLGAGQRQSGPRRQQRTHRQSGRRDRQDHRQDQAGAAHQRFRP
jgi:hypothetical protein